MQMNCQPCTAVQHFKRLSPCFPAAVMMLCSMPRPSQEFSANHPFVFMIQNIESGIVLFAGRFSRV
jgi:serine protease inhibitor